MGRATGVAPLYQLKKLKRKFASKLGSSQSRVVRTQAPVTEKRRYVPPPKFSKDQAARMPQSQKPETETPNNDTNGSDETGAASGAQPAEPVPGEPGTSQDNTTSNSTGTSLVVLESPVDKDPSAKLKGDWVDALNASSVSYDPNTEEESAMWALPTKPQGNSVTTMSSSSVPEVAAPSMARVSRMPQNMNKVTPPKQDFTSHRDEDQHGPLAVPPSTLRGKALFSNPSKKYDPKELAQPVNSKKRIPEVSIRNRSLYYQSQENPHKNGSPLNSAVITCRKDLFSKPSTPTRLPVTARNLTEDVSSAPSPHCA